MLYSANARFQKYPRALNLPFSYNFFKKNDFKT